MHGVTVISATVLGVPICTLPGLSLESVPAEVCYLALDGGRAEKLQLEAWADSGEFLADLSEQDLVEELGLTKLQARKVIARLP